MAPHRHPFKPKAQRIAEAHLASSTRGARLLAASGGDAEHAARIDRVIDDLVEHAVIPLRQVEDPPVAPAPVISLPRPYDRELPDEFDELELERVPRPVGWTVAIVLGLLGWLILAGAAWTLYALVEAIR